MRKIPGLALACLFLWSCSHEQPKPAATAAPAEPPPIAAEMIAFDPTWGNTEGPAVDSKGNLFFCSRGAFKGIVSWNQKDGARQFVALDTKFGPGGLWIDESDNIYATGIGDRVIWKVTPDKTIKVLAKGFEAKPETSKGPNDLVRATDKSIYFTDPNGFDGSSSPRHHLSSLLGRKGDGVQRHRRRVPTGLPSARTAKPSTSRTTRPRRRPKSSASLCAMTVPPAP